MRRVGVWERDEGLFDSLTKELKTDTTERTVLFRGRHPAELAIGTLDLLVVSPRATGWAGAASVNCRLILLPGSAAPLARGLRVEEAVSYGTGAKNTITLSSLEGDTLCLAIQRELVTVNGGVVERQELVLPYPAGQNPDLFMARVGALLLLHGEGHVMNRAITPQTDTGHGQTTG